MTVPAPISIKGYSFLSNLMASNVAEVLKQISATGKPLSLRALPNGNISCGSSTEITGMYLKSESF